MKRVLIIEAQIKRYRERFYSELHSALRKEQLQLKVVYSDPPASETQQRDNCDLPPKFGVKVKSYQALRERLLWQSALRETAEADLVIIDHANRFVLNHVLLLLGLLKLKKIAFWGLGENLQANRSAFSERYKERSLNWVDWWFPYTEGTARYLQEHGVPGTKITAVQNSVDTRATQCLVSSLSAEAKASLRTKLGIARAAPTGIFIGMLQRIKGVPFLLEAAERIRSAIPEFQLIVGGGGPDEQEIRDAAAGRPWIHFVGPVFDNRKAELLAISDVFLLPGRAGLAILDGFAASLPVVATRLAIHGPEIEYLEDGRNGLLSEPNPEAYASAIAKMLSHTELLRALRQGAAQSAQKYSIEAMVENFRRGIVQCLAEAEAQESRLKWRGARSASQGCDQSRAFPNR
jgi:L-malate glycosyltransferase